MKKRHSYRIIRALCLWCFFIVSFTNQACSQFIREYAESGKDVVFTACAWRGDALIVAGTVDNDMVIAAFDASGTLLGSDHISVDGGTTLTVPKSLIIDSEGFIVVAGYQWYGSESASHSFVFKYDYGGVGMVWFQTYLNTGSILTKILEPYPGADYLTSGQNGHPVDQSAVLLQVDRSTGDVSVVNNITHHPDSDTWWSVTSDGTDYYVAGRLQFYGGTINRMRPVITRFNADGSDEFITTYLREDDIDARLYTPDITFKDGLLYMLVHGDGAGTNPSQDLFVVCTDDDGDVQWTKSIDFTATSYDGIFHSIHAVDDGLLICGSPYNAGGSAGHGGPLYIMLLTYDGEVDWVTQYDIKSDQYYYMGKTDLLEVNGDDIFLVGFTPSAITGKDHGVVMHSTISAQGELAPGCTSTPVVVSSPESELAYPTTLDPIDYEGFEPETPTYPASTLTFYLEDCASEVVLDTFCFGDTYPLPDGTFADESGTYVVLPADSLIPVTYILVELDEIVSDNDTTICLGQDVTLPDGTVVSDEGIYVSTVVSVSGCDSVITTSLTVVTALVTDIVASICDGEVYTLPDGSTTASAGTYTYTLTSVGGCDSIVNIDLTVNDIYDSSLDVFICDGDSYILPDGSVVSTEGTYDVTLTAVTGCDSTITTNISVGDTYDITMGPAICEGETYVLPDGASTGTAGTYTFPMMTTEGCDSIITVTLQVNPVYDETEEISICYGEVYTFPDGSSADTTGTYPVYLTSSAGCDSAVTYELSVIIEEPVTLLIADTVQCWYSEPLQLVIYPDIPEIIWSNGDDGAATYVYEPGIYIASYTGICVADSLAVEVIYCGLVDVPNAFSPNGDGVNDFFSILGADNVDNLEVIIYNRWGEKIYESSDKNFHWDGTYNGVDQEIGVYIYVLNYTLLEKGEQSRSGSITLLR